MRCSCNQRKLRAEGVPFYTEKKFYDNIDMVFVAPRPRHPYFKECVGSTFENISSNFINSKKEDIISVKLYVLISIFWQTR